MGYFIKGWKMEGNCERGILGEEIEGVMGNGDD